MLALEVNMLPQARTAKEATVQEVIDLLITGSPKPSPRYAQQAAAMRSVGIEIRDDEYERIDSFVDVRDNLFLHLCGIAPFVARVLSN